MFDVIVKFSQNCKKVHPSPLFAQTEGSENQIVMSQRADGSLELIPRFVSTFRHVDSPVEQGNIHFTIIFCKWL